VHKANFTKLLKRLVAFVSEQSEPSADPSDHSSTPSRQGLSWRSVKLTRAASASLSRMRGTTQKQLEQAIFDPVPLLLTQAAFARR
jgi:hypothetical protein